MHRPPGSFTSSVWEDEPRAHLLRIPDQLLDALDSALMREPTRFSRNLFLIAICRRYLDRPRRRLTAIPHESRKQVHLRLQPELMMAIDRRIDPNDPADSRNAWIIEAVTDYLEEHPGRF